METALVVKRIKTVYLLLFAAVISPGGFGVVEKCVYLYSGNIPIKYSDYEQVISIGICDYLSAVFLWENE